MDTPHSRVRNSIEIGREKNMRKAFCVQFGFVSNQIYVWYFHHIHHGLCCKLGLGAITNAHRCSVCLLLGYTIANRFFIGDILLSIN